MAIVRAPQTRPVAGGRRALGAPNVPGTGLVSKAWAPPRSRPAQSSRGRRGEERETRTEKQVKAENEEGRKEREGAREKGRRQRGERRWEKEEEETEDLGTTELNCRLHRKPLERTRVHPIHAEQQLPSQPGQQSVITLRALPNYRFETWGSRKGDT